MSTTSDEAADLIDKWMCQRVYVRKGRYVGSLGSVIGFAHGRFRVQIGDGLINKLASQLELYDPALHSQQSPAVTASETAPGFKPLRPATKSAPSLIGSRVRILTGKFGGYCGFVSKGGNGYFAVEIEDGFSQTSSVVMKRSSELVILSDSKRSGEMMTPPANNGEDVRQAAIILLDLMQSEIGSKKRCRPLDHFETIEGY